MNTHILTRPAILLTGIAALLVQTASAQTITWGSATTMSADSDVLTTGALDRAYLLGGGSTTVNGVAFSSSLNGDSFTAGVNGGAGGYYGPNGGAFPNYANLTGAYQAIATYGAYSDNGSATVQLNNLNNGLEYTVQVWVNDSREFGPGGPGGAIGSRTGSIGGSPTLDYNVQNDTGGVGQFAAGTFTGTGASTALTISANASAQMNGLQLRATGVSAGNTATITAAQNWSALTVGAGATLKYNLAAATTQLTAISGAGGLEKTGAGTLTLTGALSYGGATNITGGTLRLVGVATSAIGGAARQFDASNLGLANGTGVAQWNDLSGNGQNATVPGGNGTPTYIANAGTGTGLGALNFTGGTGANDSQALTFTRDTNVRTVFSIFKGSSFLMTDSSNYGFHRPGDANPADALLQNYGGDTPNLLAGSTFVNGAQVNPESFAMPTGLHNGYNLVSMTTNGNPVAVNGFNKDRIYHSGNQSQAEVLIYDFVLSDLQRLHNESYLSNKWFGSAASLPFSPVTISNAGVLELAGNHTIPSISATDASGTQIILTGALTVGSAASTTFDGVVSGSGTLIKVGAGALTLSGNNNFNGGLTVSAGMVVAGSSSALGASGGSVTVQSGASLDINGQTLDGYTQNISIAGTGANATLGALGNNGGVNLLGIRGITLAANASIGGDGGRWDIGRLDFNGDPNITVDHINGGGFVLTKVGSSYLGLLTGATNLAGFVINGGTVAPHENTSFGAGPVTLNAATIQPWGGLNVANALTLNGGTIQTDGFNDSYNGPVAVTAASTINAIAGGNISFTGNVTGSAALHKIGAYSFFLAGDNSGYTGTLTHDESNTFLHSATAGSTGASFVVNAGNLANTTAGTVTQHLGSLAGTGGNLGNNTAGSAVTFSIGANGAGTTFSGNIVDTVGGGGTTAIAKVGGGVFTFAGAASHSGGTEVQGGTLRVSGSIVGGVTVKSGGTLGSSSGLGGGSTGAITVESGGTLAPGASTGLLTTTGNLSLTSGATFALELAGTTAGTGYDRMIVGGDVSLGGATLSLTVSFSPTNGDIFTVLLNNGVNSIGGTFTGLANEALINVGGQDYQISYFDDASTGGFETSGGNDVSLLVVPEPATAISLLGGLGLLLGLRRRRLA